MTPAKLMNATEFLGRIVRLQIQRGSLKREADGRRIYDPAPLLVVDALTLTPAGAIATAADGSVVVDVHNSGHPQTRNSGHNPLSFSFTGHYEAMRTRFGDHLVVGCVGENILVEAAGLVPLEQVSDGLVVETKQGLVPLGGVVVAAPCSPFSGYALGTPGASAAELKPALQFLGAGVRGFYCRLEGPSPVVLSVGDPVLRIVRG